MGKNEKTPLLAPCQTRRIVNPAESRERRRRGPGPHDDNDVATSCERLKPMPGRERVQAIATHYPDNGVAVAKRLDRIDGIRRTAAPEFYITSPKSCVTGKRQDATFPIGPLRSQTPPDAVAGPREPA